MCLCFLHGLHSTNASSLSHNAKNLHLLHIKSSSSMIMGLLCFLCDVGDTWGWHDSGGGCYYKESNCACKIASALEVVQSSASLLAALFPHSTTAIAFSFSVLLWAYLGTSLALEMGLHVGYHLLLVWWLQREFLFAHLMVLVSLSSFAWSLALILLSEVMSSSLIIASIRSTLNWRCLMWHLQPLVLRLLHACEHVDLTSRASSCSQLVLLPSHEDLRSVLPRDHRSFYVDVDFLVLSLVPLWSFGMKHGGRQNCWGN